MTPTYVSHFIPPASALIVDRLLRSGVAIALCRVLLKIRRVQQPCATQRTIMPQSEMLDTTQMYLSEVEDDEAISTGFTRFTDYSNEC